MPLFLLDDLLKYSKWLGFSSKRLLHLDVFDTHMNQCAQTFDTHMYQISNIQFGQDKQTQVTIGRIIFFLKQNKKTFLWHWDIGIRMNLQILNFWRVWENFEGGLDNIVRWYDGTGNMFRDDPENMLSRDFYDFNQVWRIQTPISSAICKKINKKITGHHNTF